MIQVRAALDTEQLVHLYELWEKWVEEEGKDGFSQEIWLNYMESRAKGGNWMPLVAMDEVGPVGMIECIFEHDPFDGLYYGFADHAYVIPELRGDGVFQLIYDFAWQIGVSLDVKGAVCPAGLHGNADFLKAFYESNGWQCKGFIMRKPMGGESCLNS